MGAEMKIQKWVGNTKMSGFGLTHTAEWQEMEVSSAVKWLHIVWYWWYCLCPLNRLLICGVDHTHLSSTFLLNEVELILPSGTPTVCIHLRSKFCALCPFAFCCQYPLQIWNQIHLSHKLFLSKQVKWDRMKDTLRMQYILESQLGPCFSLFYSGSKAHQTCSQHSLILAQHSVGTRSNI